jgi:hypothetical protein
MDRGELDQVTDLGSLLRGAVGPLQGEHLDGGRAIVAERTDPIIEGG